MPVFQFALTGGHGIVYIAVSFRTYVVDSPGIALDYPLSAGAERGLIRGYIQRYEEVFDKVLTQVCHHIYS